MNVTECIFKRRSVRKFKTDKISDIIINQLLESAMAAPSACNKQPWEFYVITNNELLEKLCYVSRYTNHKAPLNIIVCGNEKRALSNKINDFWIQDCSAAIQNILLTACDLELGTCWCGLYPMITPVKKVRELLELPINIIPLAIVQIGYPEEETKSRTQYNLKYIHYIQ